ncbi:MAG: alcohol dehydrogenase catalytic domain-containing protein [Vulcanimicrobiaceae bacterium]
MRGAATSLPREMRVLVLYDVDDLRIERRAVPELKAGELLVRTVASGICSGDIMAWYVRRKAPFVLGHEPAGEIVALGPGAPPCDEEGRPFAIGERVAVHHHAPCFACRACERGDYVQCATWRASQIDPGGIAEYFRVPAVNMRDTLRLPEGVSCLDGSLVEPLACVEKSLRRSGLQRGDLLYVIGLGVMGQMHLLAARASGARVIGSDFSPARCNLAQRNGAAAVHPGHALEALRAASDGRGADVVICGPGTREALEHAVSVAAPGATIVMFTPLPPGTSLCLDAGRLYFSDLRLVASYSCGPPDTRAALARIERGEVTAALLDAREVALDAVPQAYALLASGQVVKPIVTFP